MQLIDPCVVPADGAPRAKSPLLARSVKALTALQPFLWVLTQSALRLRLGATLQHKFKNLTEVRKAAFLHPLRVVSCRQGL